MFHRCPWSGRQRRHHSRARDQPRRGIRKVRRIGFVFFFLDAIEGSCDSSCRVSRGPSCITATRIYRRASGWFAIRFDAAASLSPSLLELEVLARCDVGWYLAIRFHSKNHASYHSLVEFHPSLIDHTAESRPLHHHHCLSLILVVALSEA